MLGSGDKLFIEFIDISEFSQIYSIDPTGTIYLPEINNIKVEGLSIEGLKTRLKREYSEIINSPEFNIQISAYRPVKAMVLGEVRKPGSYVISKSGDLGIEYDRRKKVVQRNADRVNLLMDPQFGQTIFQSFS